MLCLRECHRGKQRDPLVLAIDEIVHRGKIVWPCGVDRFGLTQGTDKIVGLDMLLLLITVHDSKVIQGLSVSNSVSHWHRRRGIISEVGLFKSRADRHRQRFSLRAQASMLTHRRPLVKRCLAMTASLLRALWSLCIGQSSRQILRQHTLIQEKTRVSKTDRTQEKLTAY